MPRSLENRVAIVSGGALGIGRATAILFAKHGARVVVADIKEEAGSETVDHIRKEGGTAIFFRADMRDEAAVEDMVGCAVATFGGLDCAVNNAGLTPDTAMIADLDAELFDRMVAVNLRGVALSMKYEVRQMLKQGRGGAIVNIASINGLRPQPACPAYSASKAGVISLTKCTSMDYARQGIRVNCVLPGSIETDMLRDAAASRGRTLESYGPEISLFGRLGQPDEVAEANLWLCSDASSYVTGHPLAVDAGYTSS